MSLYAETNGYAEYDGRSHKLLSDNRELYMRQSAMTVNGRVPTAEEVRASFQPHRQDEAAASRGALADGDFSTEAALLGVNVVERAPANNHEASRPASTQSPLKDEQPRLEPGSAWMNC